MVRTSGAGAAGGDGVPAAGRLGGGSPDAEPDPTPLQRGARRARKHSQDLPTRSRDTRDCIDALFSLVHLYHAALLPGWRDQHPDHEVAEVIASTGMTLSIASPRRPQRLYRRDPVGGRGHRHLIARLTQLGHDGRSAFSASSAPALAQVIRQGAPEARPLAAAPLGRIEADADTERPALEEALASDSRCGRAAATALADLLQA